MRHAITRSLLAASFLAGAICHAAPDLPRAAFLGVQAGPVKEGKGAIVMGLLEGGSAKAAGLQPDDVIVAVDDEPVEDPGQLVARLGQHRAGDRVKIRWLRDGKAEENDVVIRPRPFESSPGTRVTYGAVAVEGALRRSIVTLEAKGLRLINQHGPDSERIYAELARRFGHERLAQLYALLQQLQDAIEDMPRAGES